MCGGPGAELLNAERLALSAPPRLSPVPLVLVATLFFVALFSQASALEPWSESTSTVLLAVASIGGILMRLPRRVLAGPEGLEVVDLGRRRLVPFRDVLRARPEGGGVVLTLATGETLVLTKRRRDDGEPRALLDRIWLGLAAAAEGGVRPAEAAALARGRRSMRAWVRALRALAPPGAHYRQGLVPRERLWAIAENPTLPRAARAAAAVALADASEEARTRLARIVTATLDPALASILRAIAEAGGEDDLERALALVPQDPPVARSP